MTLKKDLTLTGSKLGVTLKMYDEDWFGNDVRAMTRGVRETMSHLCE